MKSIDKDDAQRTGGRKLQAGGRPKSSQCLQSKMKNEKCCMHMSAVFQYCSRRLACCLTLGISRAVVVRQKYYSSAIGCAGLV